ncbi:LacI family DNA-binding transcriptional regulator [Arthrobacter castelli]|uniref:LacI family DNA-binding transcriptional regulator n=1 Tax=Arthrobacter castelli TaxID=271431 RepID=UPI000422792E|nr:LacI family DNA-binding transcriptional regulator [Arthrobacter castelli]
MTVNTGQPARVTRKDVARYAGVSTAVVSYVINAGPKKVAPGTEAKVLDAIQVLGYRPNAAARALKLGSTEMLGLVIPGNTNPFFAELSEAIEQAANERGYALLLTSSDGATSKERKHVRNLLSRQVDGLLLTSVEDEPYLDDVIASGIPAVLLNRYQPSEHLPSVGVDLAEGARAAVEHLIWHGYENIGLVKGISASRIPDEREEGWASALTKAGLREGQIFTSTFSMEGGYRAGQRIAAARDRPTAVFVSSDAQAVGVLRALHEAGLQVPQDIALVSFDASFQSAFTWPALTAMHQPTEQMAEAAVSALLDRETASTENMVFPTDLVVRRSCGCLPES